MHQTFTFGPFRLAPGRQSLLRDGTSVRIGSRALDLLIALVERPGELVTKAELMARAWPGTTVDEANLKVNMAALRRALDAGSGAESLIATIPGRGYRFVAPVRKSTAPDAEFDPEPVPARHHNLPIGIARIFGRSHTIEALERDLDESRIVSVVGPGGIGKTTVAIAVAERFKSAPDGVWWVDFATLRDPALATHAIAKAVGLTAQTNDLLTALCSFLSAREMVILFDNCEHVIDVVADSAGRILAAAAGVKILASSREPLSVNGERVRRLAALDAPPASRHLTAEEALEFPAIQLFVERATDWLETFSLRDADVPAAVEICRRLDGLALAIELAATRVDTFGVSGLLKQLDERFLVLKGRRAGDERHRTLAATLDWSYGLLAEGEAATLRAVAVFAGAFDVDDASVVAGSTKADAADALAQLATKSLLATYLEGGVAYRLLETTRAYCLEQLLESGEDAAIRKRHAEHVCHVLERGTSEWAQRSPRDWERDYARLLDDLRGALAWAGRDPAHRALGIRLTVAGLLLWNQFSLLEECRTNVAKAVEDLQAAGLVGTAFEMHLQVWLGAGTMFTQGPKPSALEALQRALELATLLGDTECRLRCLRTIGLYQHLTGDHTGGLSTFEAFASLVAATTSRTAPEGEAHLSISEFFVGRLESAQRRLEHLRAHAAPGARKTQTLRYQSDIDAVIGCVLTIVQWLTGSPDTSARTAQETVAYALETKHQLTQNEALAAACPVFYWSGRYEECSRCITMLDELGARYGILTRRPTARFYHAALTLAEDPAAGIDAIERVIAEFRAMHHMARMPYYLGVLADAQAKCGRLDHAEATIEIALALVHTQNEGWCRPEVLRVKASILAAKQQAGEAEAVLVQSMAFAQQSGALSWRLRAANDLAALWLARSKGQDAHEILLPIYDAFTEGFETPDLRAAAQLLRQLGRHQTP